MFSKDGFLMSIFTRLQTDEFAEYGEGLGRGQAIGAISIVSIDL